MKQSDPYFNEDKSIKLYREKYRSGHLSEGKLNPKWQCKLKLATGIPALKFSTGTANFKQALRTAEVRLDEARAKQNLGLPTHIKRFDVLARQYLKDLENQKRDNECSEEKFELHERTINNHFIAKDYFGKKEVSKIKSKDVDEYFKARGKEPATKAYKDSYGNIQHKTLDRRVGNSYLNKECQVLRAIFKYGIAKDHITQMPHIPSLKVKDSIKQGLSLEDWEYYRDYLDSAYVTEVLATKNSKLIYYRAAFAEFAKLSVLTGLRTTEALRLKWSDWSVSYEDNKEIGFLKIRAEEKGARKTGKERTIKVHSKVNSILAIRRDNVDFTNAEDYIFSHPSFVYSKSSPIQSVQKAFNTSMQACELLTDEFGNKRSPYIFRHTHAHLSRNAGKSIDDIANDLGNLVTTAERFYIGINTGDRKGLPFDIE